jgi:hypothetical protein
MFSSNGSSPDYPFSLSSDRDLGEVQGGTADPLYLDISDVFW